MCLKMKNIIKKLVVMIMVVSVLCSTTNTAFASGTKCKHQYAHMETVSIMSSSIEYKTHTYDARRTDPSGGYEFYKVTCVITTIKKNYFVKYVCDHCGAVTSTGTWTDKTVTHSTGA